MDVRGQHVVGVLPRLNPLLSEAVFSMILARAEKELARVVLILF